VRKDGDQGLADLGEVGAREGSGAIVDEGDGFGGEIEA